MDGMEGYVDWYDVDGAVGFEEQKKNAILMTWIKFDTRVIWFGYHSDKG